MNTDAKHLASIQESPMTNREQPQGEPRRCPTCKHCGLRIYFDETSPFKRWRHHGSNFTECHNIYPAQSKETYAEPADDAQPEGGENPHEKFNRLLNKQKGCIPSEPISPPAHKQPETECQRELDEVKRQLKSEREARERAESALRDMTHYAKELQHNQSILTHIDDSDCEQCQRALAALKSSEGVNEP